MTLDRRSFLRGSVGLAMAGAFVQLDLGVAGAGTDPGPVSVPLPLPSWPPTPGAFPGLVADWVVAENARPGSDGWNIGPIEPAGALATTQLLAPLSIEGYLDVTSATVGQRIAFHVSSATPTYRIEAYRMGWYQGHGGRLVWTSRELPGVIQGPPVVDEAMNTVEAGWDTSFELTLRARRFVPGCYLFRLVATDGASRLVPLTIRDDASEASFLVVNPVANWQAYNEWGGASLYYGRRTTDPSRTYENRARAVSYDRPHDWGQGAADFIGADLPLIMRLEEAGLDVTYATSIDVHTTPKRLQQHAAVLSTAHDEYWTMQMRNGFETARDAGVNLVFFGANAMFRQVRLEDTAHGPNRLQVCYKAAHEDPISATTPEYTTVNWRAAPVNLPEAALVGVQYDGLGIADLEVTHPDGWLWEGTGVTLGQKFAGVIGPEFDRVFDSSPPNIQVFARSAIEELGGRQSWADTVYYSAASGAGVFASGTIGWISSLQPADLSGTPREPALYHATMNVLRLFGTGPAGATRPSIPNAGSARPSTPPKKPRPTPAPTVPIPETPPTEVPPDDPGLIPII